MVRPRRSSAASEESTGMARDQELGSMYDYLAKIILLGPSGSGKSCLLHRFVKNEWRVLSSQTIGVEFASKIIKVGTGARRKRIKLQVRNPPAPSSIFNPKYFTDISQLWDTAGTERFRSVSRSYYRGAAGALLVYDISSHNTFSNLSSFMNDARALASPDLTLILVGNKVDLAENANLIDLPPATPSSVSSKDFHSGSVNSTTSVGTNMGLGTQLRATIADGREVSAGTASKWASSNNVPVSVEVSALNGDNVDEVFGRLARMILTKIELGEIDPDDPMSGIQYGDGGWMGDADGASVKSGMTGDESGATRRRKKKGKGWMGGGGLGGMREWEEVFTLSGSSRRRRGGCC
ncbi:P-loop containing nucleoside triphosphate hydrolase protein [Amylocarpus encephaloides]|uniref:P-loop containing nucleoside triphosphate hydrolase protein n=1 Tax=Amylocarpus encephaloides TaxID=45428 RepID=A0A9P8C763_9HELO|nr:P-loop containing nucleoside triphosphate hydrolase protein [Amylocarpus encephaloides]